MKTQKTSDLNTATDYVTPTLWTMAGLFGSIALSPVGALIGIGFAAVILAIGFVVSR